MTEEFQSAPNGSTTDHAKEQAYEAAGHAKDKAQEAADRPRTG
jgi:hypothetical protein